MDDPRYGRPVPPGQSARPQTGHGARLPPALAGVLEPSSVAALLIWWRLYTFYLPAVIGGGILVLGGFASMRR